MRATRFWLPLLLALSLVRGLLYSAVLPLWQGPDEPLHYEYARLLYEKGRLVQWGDSLPEVEREIIASMDRFDFWRTGRYQQRGTTFREVWGGSAHQLHQPPLAYIFYSGALLLVPQEIDLQLYLMRMLSVLLGVVPVVAAAVVGTVLRDLHPSMSWSVPAFVTFLPTYTTLSGTVNNDHLAAAAVSVVLALWVLILRSGLSISRIAGLIAASVVGLFAKRTALVLAPAHLVAVLLYLWVHKERLLSRKRIGYTVGIGGVTVVLVVWLGSRAFSLLSERAPAVAEWLVKIYLFLPSKQFPFSLDQAYFSAEALRRYRHYARFLFETFWGRFAWLQVQWPFELYALAAVLSALAGAGLILFAYRVRKGTYGAHKGQLASVGLFVFSLVAMLIMVYVNEIRRWDLGWGGWPQARYLFVVIVPIAALFMLGWSQLIPRRYRNVGVAGLICLLLLLDAYSVGFRILPYFYG